METQLQESCKLPRNGRRVILFPFPFQGHINPMLQLGTILHGHGFSITIIHTNFNSPNSSNYPLFDFHSISDGFSETESFPEDITSIISSINANCVLPFRDCSSKLMSKSQKGSYYFSCLITDSFWYFSRSVCEEFNLPTLVLHTYGASYYLSSVAYPSLLEKGYNPMQDSQSEAPVSEFPQLRKKDLPNFRTHNMENVYKLVKAVDDQIKASSGMIWNSFQLLEQIELTTIQKQYFPIPVFTIGPVHKYFPASSSSLPSQEQASISWLDKQAPRSVIYVSFGSVADINETGFLEIAWGLANSQVAFLWVVRPGLVRGSEWLEPLPKGFLEMIQGRGLIVKWAPQQEVLTHPSVGGFWTHSGWNSTLEGICEGVPMICQPCFGDQMLNARYVSHVWRVGLNLEGKLMREEIESAIRRVMVEDEGNEMRERILQLKEEVNVCQRQGGTSFQSLERLIDHILSF